MVFALHNRLIVQRALIINQMVFTLLTDFFLMQYFYFYFYFYSSTQVAKLAILLLALLKYKTF